MTGRRSSLGGRAFDVLVALVERRERTVSKNELMDLVWPTVVVEENNLEVQIVTLRKLLGYAAIATIPGRGYRFTLPVEVLGGPRRSQPVVRDQPDPAHARVPVSAPLLYGRDEDLRALNRMLAEHPLVTVTGAGGIGKTRLAQTVASELGREDPAAVHWVELATLSEPSMVPIAVARALGVTLDDAQDPTQSVVAALRGRSALLVLDNAEHLLEGVAALVSRVRKDAASVRLLITSQEVLRTLDEQVFRMTPLSLPADDSLTAARASGAVALFVARAHAVDRRFELTEENLTPVVDICRHLDGIPLAIELAAARVALLSVKGVQQRLDERFNVLTAGKRAVLRRHQTLRAALEWSHGLLTPQEQIIFRRLGVFSAGFTLEAAQSLLQDEAIDGWDALEHMGALVDKSLLVAEGDPVPRYRMLETTRLFALERLADAGETHALLVRHALYYCELVENQNRMLPSSGGLAGLLAVLDPERDNFMHALSWCAQDATDDAARVGQRLAGALRYYWSARGLVTIGLQLTRTALSMAAHLPPDADRSHALGSVATLQLHLGENEAALAVAVEQVCVARQVGDRAELAAAFARAGFAAGILGREEEARRHLAAALEEARAAGHVQVECLALSGLARIDYDAGRLAEAAAQGDAVVELGRTLPAPHQMAVWLLNAADAWLSLDQVDRARPYLQEAAALYRQSDSRMVGQLLVDHAATLSALASDWTLAVRLLGAAVALRQVSAVQAHKFMAHRHERARALARSVLGPADYDQALLEGRRMTYGEAVQLAITAVRLPVSCSSDEVIENSKG